MIATIKSDYGLQVMKYLLSRQNCNKDFSASDIAKSLKRNYFHMATVTKRLEKEKMIEVYNLRKDKRKRYLKLTARGEVFINKYLELEACII